MRNIVLALAITTLAGYSADAQQASKKPVAETSNKMVVKTIVTKHRARRKPQPPQDFPICRGNNGYYICGEAMTQYNTTNPGFSVAEKPAAPLYQYGVPVDRTPRPYVGGVQAPPSQSFPENTSTVSGVCDYPYSIPHYIVLGPF